MTVPPISPPAVLTGRTLTLSQFRGRPVVIYFFPRAFTPGCTAETRRFRDNYDDLQRFGAEVIGISTDDHERQCEFAEAEKVKFPLIGDKNAEIQALYGVKLPILKSNRRVTFVIDEDGAVAAVFHHEFQVLRHMDDVRQFFEKRSRSKASDAPPSTSARPSPESKNSRFAGTRCRSARRSSVFCRVTGRLKSAPCWLFRVCVLPVPMALHTSGAASTMRQHRRRRPPPRPLQADSPVRSDLCVSYGYSTVELVRATDSVVLIGRADLELGELLGRRLVRGVGHEIRALLRLGERDDVAQALGAADRSSQRGPCRARCRRGAARRTRAPSGGSRIVLCVGVADAERAEHALLYVGIVQANRSAADLEAVEDEIVAVAEHLARIVLDERTCSSCGRVKAWCAATHDLCSSSYSKSGGFTTQRNFHLSPCPYSGMRPIFLATCTRRLAMTVCTSDSLPNWKQMRSPGLAPTRGVDGVARARA